MSLPFAIVCDSLADLSLAWYEANEVEVVPFKLRTPQSVYDDVCELDSRDATALFDISAPVQILAPSVADFRACFERLAAKGFERCVCVCATPYLTNTYPTACLATEGLAGTCSMEVTVIDSGAVSVGEGMVVCDLVRTRLAGLDFGEALNHAIDLANHSSMLMAFSPKNGMRESPRLSLRSKVLTRIDRTLGRWILSAFDGKGQPQTVARSRDPEQLAILVASLVMVDGEREGLMVHAGFVAGEEPEPRALVGAVKNQLSQARSLGVVEASGVVAYRAGPGGFGIAYVPERYIYVDDTLPKLVNNPA